MSHTNILDQYLIEYPEAQNIIDLFQGEWSSKLPKESKLTTHPGSVPLFEDARVVWVEQMMGSFSGLKILELGPLEGGHSYMLQKMGATQVRAIEANTRTFLKCLCIKEIFKLDRVEFLLGDFVQYLEKEDKPWDLVFASGVLYHMEDPVYLLKLISKVTQHVFLWTHYYDHDLIGKNNALSHKFGKLKHDYFEGFEYQYAIQSYKEALNWSGFCGGPLITSKWLTRESIFGILKVLGFNKISVQFEQTDHANGPAFTLFASK